MLENVAAGEYSVTIEDGRGCEVTQVVVVGSTEEAPETPEIMVTDVINLSIPDSYSSYQWLLDGEAIDGANTNTYMATESGDYSVEVTNAAGCGTTSGTVNVVLTFTAEELGLERFSVSPNPFSDNLFVEMSTQTTGQYLLTVKDVNGKQLWALKTEINGSFQREISLRNQPAGVYLFTVEKGDKKMVERLIKQ